MARAEVEQRYGHAASANARDDYYFPAGTRYYGKTLTRAVYRPNGAVLQVDYVDGRVKVIWTSSVRYRSATGLGVGSHLPRDLCVRLDDAGHIGPPGCKTRWRGFSFDGDCLGAWLTSGQGDAMTLLYVHRGRTVDSIQIGDPDVILPCF